MPLSTSKPKRVAIVIENRAEYGRRAIRGIIDYAREHGAWEIVYEFDYYWQSLGAQNLAGCDGMISQSAPLLGAASRDRWSRAKVGIFMGRSWKICPSVCEDNLAIGSMACHHLTGLGFRNLGMCSMASDWAALRQQGFCQAADGAGLSAPAILKVPKNLRGSRYGIIQKVADWLTKQTPPVGLFVANDTIARLIIGGCREAGLMIPEQVAVLGVDDDELVCQLTTPPLSSIDHGAYQIGYAAAGLLDRIMRRERVRPEPVIIAPVGVVIRQSTNSLAVPDADVALALRHIREGVRNGVRVRDLLKAVPASRSKLERAFKKLFGRTINQEILRSRVVLAQEQLTHSRRGILDIAIDCGFSNRQHLNVAFKSIVGETPTSYRAQFRTQPQRPHYHPASNTANEPSKRGETR